MQEFCFFCDNVEKFFKQAIITCVLYKGNDKYKIIDRKDFTEDALSNYNNVMAFLLRNLRLEYKIETAGPREEVLEIPEDALREAVVNSMAHRDYFEKGTNIMVEMFDDRIEITNFGGLAKGLKPEDFGKKSVLRNPNIANLLHRAGYIEKMGTGINKMKKLISKAGLPPIKFEFDTFFTATLKIIHCFDLRS